MAEKPGFLSYDRKTALSSDVIVIRRQVLIEGTVRLRFLEETEPPFPGGHPSHAKV